MHNQNKSEGKKKSSENYQLNLPKIKKKKNKQI